MINIDKLTLQQQVDLYSSGELMYGDVLDGWYNRSAEELVEHVKDEPDWSTLEKHQITNIVASIEHILILKKSKEYPDWLADDKFILKEPRFACKSGSNLMVILFAESPFSFRRRGLFVSENSIHRV